MEQDEALRRVVGERWNEFLRTGEAVSHEALAQWIRARVRGEKRAKLKPRRVLQ